MRWITQEMRWLRFAEMGTDVEKRLFDMMFEYLIENYPNVLSEMIQCAKEESSE